jgi:hypothetical protein
MILFNINFSPYKVENPSLLEKKYINLLNLLVGMKKLHSEHRPNCEEILKQKDLWALSDSQMKSKLKIEINSNNSFQYSTKRQNDSNSQNHISAKTDQQLEDFLETKLRLDLNVAESEVQHKPNPVLSADQRTDGQNKSGDNCQ